MIKTEALDTESGIEPEAPTGRNAVALHDG